MSIIEKYKWYKAGIVKRNVDERMQLFFKTNPTDEQLILLDEMNNESNIAFGVGVFFAILLGIIIGLGIMYYWLYFKYLLGIPLF